MEQYGLLNSIANLICSVLNHTDGTVITWTFPNSTEEVITTTEDPVTIEHVGLHHEGAYMCEVFLSDKDLIVRTPVNFVVIGKQN